MQDHICPQESVVVVSIRSGSWDETLLNHLDSCPHCGELVQVMEWTRSLTTDVEWPPLSDPDLLWIKSQHLQAQTAQRRTMRKFLFLQTGCTALLVVLAALLAVSRQGLETIVLQMLASIRRIETLEWSALYLSTTVAIGVALLIGAVTLVIQPLLSED